MKKAIKNFAWGVVSTVLSCVALVNNASALSVQDGAEAARGDMMPAELVGDNGIITRFTNVALEVIGAVSVMMLVYGGLRYILSGGDSKKVTDAKNTILYAIIGLIVSLFAYAIVHFIIGTLAGVSEQQA